MADSPFTKQTFAMQVSDEMYLDNLGKLTDKRPKDIPVYGMSGGLLQI
jgi:hypothetical protein